MYNIEADMDLIKEEIQIILAHPNDIYAVTLSTGDTTTICLEDKQVTFPVCYSGLEYGIGLYDMSLEDRKCIPYTTGTTEQIKLYIELILNNLSKIPDRQYRRAILFLPLTLAVINAVRELGLPCTAFIMEDIKDIDPYYNHATTLEMDRIIENFPDLDYCDEVMWKYAQPFFDIVYGRTVDWTGKGTVTTPLDVLSITNKINRCLDVYEEECSKLKGCSVRLVPPYNYASMRSDIAPIIRDYIQDDNSVPLRVCVPIEASRAIAKRSAKYLRASIKHILHTDSSIMLDYYRMWFDTDGHICLRSNAPVRAEDIAACLG